MKNKFEKLHNSIMFNLSLSSKELFHSNLLGYLFTIDRTLFSKVTGIENCAVKEVKREFNNIDIEITDEKGRKYLIENKVKDIIDSPQLEKIQNTCANYEEYFLFSLLGDNLEKLPKKYPLWTEIGYEHIIVVLKNHSFTDPGVEVIKNDYCEFMSEIISLLKEHYSNCEHYKLHWDGNHLLEQYKSVRLHDLFQKYGVSHFASYFRKKYPNTNIVCDFGYHRNGIITFKSNNKILQKAGIEIQIEDGQYRKSIVGPVKSEKEILGTFEGNGWFDRNWKSARNLPYLSFDHKDGNKRWYQVPVKVNDMSYEDLADMLVCDFMNVENTLLAK